MPYFPWGENDDEAPDWSEPEDSAGDEAIATADPDDDDDEG